jgi:hypothetical protein
MAMTRDQSVDEEISNKRKNRWGHGDKSHISIDKLIQKRWQENQTNSPTRQFSSLIEIIYVILFVL